MSFIKGKVFPEILNITMPSWWKIAYWDILGDAFIGENLTYLEIQCKPNLRTGENCILLKTDLTT